MGDRLAYDMALAEILTVFYGMYPPVQCAPSIGVHQGCEHAEQSRPTAHFTIDAGGTCTRNSRVSGRCVGDCCATGAVAGRAELVPSTVAPPVDVPRGVQSPQQSPATARHVTRGC